MMDRFDLPLSFPMTISIVLDVCLSGFNRRAFVHHGSKCHFVDQPHIDARHRDRTPFAAAKDRSPDNVGPMSAISQNQPL
jgi:hypothetical protein